MQRKNTNALWRVVWKVTILCVCDVNPPTGADLQALIHSWTRRGSPPVWVQSMWPSGIWTQPCRATCMRSTHFLCLKRTRFKRVCRQGDTFSIIRFWPEPLSVSQSSTFGTVSDQILICQLIKRSSSFLLPSYLPQQCSSFLTSISKLMLHEPISFKSGTLMKN